MPSLAGRQLPLLRICAQIHALSTDVHYAGKYYYKEKEKQKRNTLRMNDFARHMNTSHVFKRQKSLRLFAIMKSAAFFLELCIGALFKQMQLNALSFITQKRRV